MAGKYIIGVDNGSQSSKVVIYDLEGNAVAEGRQVLRPASRPRPGVVEHPDDDLWDSIIAASRQAMAAFKGDPREIIGVGLCTIRCCKAFLRADGSLATPVMSWMDTRAYQPWLPDDPAVAYATTSSGYLAHRFTGELRDTAANNILFQWPIDTDTWQWSDDPALFEQFNVCGLHELRASCESKKRPPKGGVRKPLSHVISEARSKEKIGSPSASLLV